MFAQRKPSLYLYLVTLLASSERQGDSQDCLPLAVFRRFGGSRLRGRCVLMILGISSG